MTGQITTVPEHSWEQVCVCVCRYLQNRSRQDDVSTEGTLRVKALLFAVVGLSQRHGQRRLGVHLQDTAQVSHIFIVLNSGSWMPPTCDIT